MPMTAYDEIAYWYEQEFPGGRPGANFGIHAYPLLALGSTF